MRSNKIVIEDYEFTQAEIDAAAKYKPLMMGEPGQYSNERIALHLARYRDEHGLPFEYSAGRRIAPKSVA